MVNPLLSPRRSKGLENSGDVGGTRWRESKRVQSDGQSAKNDKRRKIDRSSRVFTILSSHRRPRPETAEGLNGRAAVAAAKTTSTTQASGRRMIRRWLGLGRGTGGQVYGRPRRGVGGKQTETGARRSSGASVPANIANAPMGRPEWTASDPTEVHTGA